MSSSESEAEVFVCGRPQQVDMDMPARRVESTLLEQMWARVSYKHQNCGYCHLESTQQGRLNTCLICECTWCHMCSYVEKRHPKRGISGYICKALYQCRFKQGENKRRKLRPKLVTWLMATALALVLPLYQLALDIRLLAKAPEKAVIVMSLLILIAIKLFLGKTKLKTARRLN